MNITLLDGREMTLHLKKEQPEKIDNNNLQFDLTGQYMRIGKHGFFTPDDTIIERGMASFNNRLFVENAWFLYENTDRIFNGSCMFFAPIDTGSHLAYFGKSGFKNACIGVYLEWWKNLSEYSIDKNGNLIWYMAGSPLTGANCCSSVTPAGESVKMAEDTSFREAWQSFIEVNRLYAEPKQRCEAYSLQEVLVMLKGGDYKKYLGDLKQECIDWTVVYNNRPNWPADGTDLKKKVKASRKTQMQIKWREIMEFDKLFSKKEEELNSVKEQGHTEKYRELLHELAGLSTEFISTTFGRNTNRICLTDILNYALYRKSLGYSE